MLRVRSGGKGRLDLVRILVVDDDQGVRDSLRRSLVFNGYEVDLAGNGEEALRSVAAKSPDAVILDVMMPRLDGIATCRALRATGNDLPILVLTARDAVADRVTGLDAGADDYLSKPFSLDELLARLRALLRRSTPGTDASELSYADLTLDPRTREVQRGKRPDQPDPYGVRPPGAAPATSAPGPRAYADPRGGLGLRLPHLGKLAGGLRRLPSPQDRGRRRAAPAPHRPRSRVRTPRHPAVSTTPPPAGPAGPPGPALPTVASRERNLSLRSRVGLLAALGVGLIVVLVSIAAYVTVRVSLLRQVDDSLLDRARAAAAGPLGRQQYLAGVPSEALGAADIRIALVNANGSGTTSRAQDGTPLNPPVGRREVSVARGRSVHERADRGR